MPVLSMPAKNVLTINMKCGPSLVWHLYDYIGAPPDNPPIHLIDFVRNNDAVPAPLA